MAISVDNPTTLLPAQESHWELMCALAPGSPGNARLVAVDNRFIDAPLDRHAMSAAFADLTSRHDALRLMFDSVECDPRLRIAPAVEPAVAFLDLSALPESRQRDRISEIVYEQTYRTFDLTREPAWFAYCANLGTNRFFLNVVLSEIIGDGWTTKVFMEDLLRAYAARLGGQRLSDPPLSFAQMHAIQNARLEPREDRLEFWRAQLSPLPHIELFTPRIRDDTPVLARQGIVAEFSPELLSALAHTAWRCRTTVYMVLMASYHILLSALTGQDRTVLSTVNLNRLAKSERRALLPCTIDSYVATTLKPDTSLEQAVRLAHKAMQGAQENLVSFTSVARAVNPRFDEVRPWTDSHLCDGNFYAAAFDDEQITLAGMRVHGPLLRGRPSAERGEIPSPIGALTASQRAAWIDFCGPSMEVGPKRDSCALIFNPEMFDYDEMHAHLDAYRRVVELVVSSPRTTVRELRSDDALRRSERLAQ